MCMCVMGCIGTNVACGMSVVWDVCVLCLLYICYICVLCGRLCDMHVICIYVCGMWCVW